MGIGEIQDLSEPSPSWFHWCLAGLALQMYSQMSARGDGMKDTALGLAHVWCSCVCC